MTDDIICTRKSDKRGEIELKAVEAMILKAARQEGAKVEVGILVTVRGRRSFLFPFSLERPVNMNPTQEMTTLRNSFLRVIPKHF